MFTKQLFDILNDLHKNYGAIAVKSEFAQEAATLEETLMLANLAKQFDMDLTIKIGGCEALKDMYDAENIGANSVVAPMIESPYALKKFVTLSDDMLKSKKLFINIETITGFKNIDEILNSDSFKNVSGIVFGRSDFAKSLNLRCSDSDTDKVFDYVNSVSKKIKETGKEFIVGGNISKLSVPFLKQLPYITKFETRKIIFSADVLKTAYIDKAIQKAIEFEIEWINNKSSINDKITVNDEKRLKLLEARCNS